METLALDAEQARAATASCNVITPQLAMTELQE
jgi:hypothetical protein